MCIRDRMKRHRRHGKSLFFPEPAHLDQVDEAFYVLLDLFQAAEFIQLVQQLLQAHLRLGLVPDRGRVLLRHRWSIPLWL